MIAFLVMATALVLVALVVLLRGALGTRDDQGMAAALRTENIAIAREQLAALDLSKDSGAIGEDDYAEERRRIETTLSRELEHDGNERESRPANMALVALIALFVPASAAWLYTQIGTPAAIIATAAAPSPTRDAGTGSAAPALAELIPRLEQRLAEQPDDVMGWRLLGRTYIGMEQFGRAVQPLERAIGLEPDHAGTHAQLAEALAMRAGGDLSGAALDSLERAHALDPRHEQTLWLLGIARQQANRHAEAIALLESLRSIAGAAGNTQAVITIDDYLATSRAALADVSDGVGEAPARSPMSVDEPAASGPAQQPVAQASLSISVSLGEAARAATDPAQTVFVYARAADGPPMPLAVQRLNVADLPLVVRLDESMAMLPTLSLAGFADVVVGARVSSTGQPTPSSGDWSIETTAVVGEDGRDDAPLELTILEQLP